MTAVVDSGVSSILLQFLQINQFGYTFMPFMDIGTSGKRPLKVAYDPVPRDARSLGLLHKTSYGWNRLIAGRAVLTVDLPGYMKQAPSDSLTKRHVLVASHNYPLSDDANSYTGDLSYMRLVQILDSLSLESELDCTVHMISLQPQVKVAALQYSLGGRDVRMYYGDMLGQVSLSTVLATVPRSL